MPPDELQNIKAHCTAFAVECSAQQHAEDQLLTSGCKAHSRPVNVVEDAVAAPIT